MGTHSLPAIQNGNAYDLVRRSSRANKGQHSRFGSQSKKKRRKVDVVEDDDGEIRCLCGDNEDDGGFMIQCEQCGKWQHGECMGYEDPEEVNDSYACELCRPDLYKDITDKTQKAKSKKTKKTPEKVISHLEIRLMQKSTKRKTPPSDDEDSDDSDEDSEFSVDDEPISSRKKSKTSLTSPPPPPPPKPPTQEPKKKPPPITTTRRPSQTSSQHQRRTSASATPSTPLHSAPLLATKFKDLADQKRVPAARIFAKIFEPLDPTKSESLGLSIEHALYTAYATNEPGYGAEYKNKFRSISFNLKDAKNSALRERVLNRSLSPDELVHLSNEELANQELRAQAEKIREEGVANSVLKVQIGPRIRRTHKGEEIVGDEVSAISPAVGEAVASLPFARKESPTVEEAASPRSASPRVRSPSPKSPMSPEPMDTTPERKGSAFDISDVWTHLRSPTSEKGPNEMSLDILPEESQNIDDPDIDRLLGDDVERHSPPYSPSAYELPDSSAHIPPIWTGTIAMPSVAHLNAQARFVGGPHTITDLPWSKILASNLIVDGRIAIESTTKYLEAQRLSSTKNIIVIQIDPADESQKDMHRKLFQYFHDRKRYGVLRNESSFVKDAYLIPLSAEEAIPEQIELMDSHEISRIRTEPSILLILVIHKNIPDIKLSPTIKPPRPSMSLASPSNQEAPKTFSPAASMSPTTAQPPTFSPRDPTPAVPDPASLLSALGLSGADILALQAVIVAHPEILSNPQLLTNPSVLQSLIAQHLAGEQKPSRW
jgi:hypothetical protein